MDLFKHQKEALKKAKQFDKFALYMDFGTGKTITALEWLKYKKSFPVFVICPKSVIHQWYKEAERVGIPESDITVTNYEMLHRFMSDSFGEQFKAVVVDESTYVKNPQTKRTKRVFTLVKQVRYALLLSAVPAPHNYNDLYSQMRIIDAHHQLGTNYWVFLNRHYANLMKYLTFDTIPKVYTSLSEEELRKTYYRAKRGRFPVRLLKEGSRKLIYDIVSQHSVIIDKSVLDLPSKNHIVHEVPLSKDQEKKIRMIQPVNALDRFIKTQRIVNGAGSKLLMLLEILDVLGTEKVIIWAHYRDDIEMLHDSIPNSVVVHGGTQNRPEVFHTFLHGNARVLIAQQRAAGIGTNLTPIRYAIYYSNSLNFEDRVQSEDRIHRIGQTDSVFLIDLVAHSTDKDILNAYKNGQDIQQYLKSGQ